MIEYLLALLWVIPFLVIWGALIEPLGWPFHHYPMYSGYLPLQSCKVYALKFRKLGDNNFEYWEPEIFLDKSWLHTAIARQVKLGAAESAFCSILLRVSLIAELNGEMKEVAELQLVTREFQDLDGKPTLHETVMFQFSM